MLVNLDSLLRNPDPPIRVISGIFHAMSWIMYIDPREVFRNIDIDDTEALIGSPIDVML